ncbi:uncharacterized protein LOC124359675 [Homalodisca vitripennis]|uniref:uncharacterized protein LOC124359675 n=1 Tax=Homalodisca vitripennis TaxID=197043 RepID=UPI001EECC6A0|nr:uncharacterized protein LOC124359675 [Homalodisca vitripennis]XP_046668571.1 uncharacterized protein LOC124359675 [Homalodisca vitripennis]KAG8321651.1 hypothetical protein J6590_043235 [Homalodisca vitripennis]
MTTSSFPEWLTDDFFKTCLETDKENFDGITVTSHELESAVAPGNNYGSHIIRANVRYKKQNDDSTDHSTSLILKAPLSEDSAVAQQLGDSFKQLYLNEIKYYCEFISETYTLSKHDVVPKHYRSPIPLCLVMEDLIVSGFKMVDRHKLLDFDHCKLYTEASAKLHAFAMAVYKSNPELIEYFDMDRQSIDESYKVMIPNSLLCMATYLEDKPNYKKQYEVFKIASENDLFWIIYKEIMDACKTKSFKALIQDDPWCTNMMFRYNKAEKPVSVKIIDFQNIKLSSPFVEFVTFLSISANLEVRQTNLNDLYQIYCDSLNTNLTKLGCSERLSIEELKTEITYLHPITLFVICMLPIVLSDSVLNVEEFAGVKYTSESVKDSSFYKTFYTGSYFEMYYPQIFDVYEKQGFFDYMLGKLGK